MLVAFESTVVHQRLRNLKELRALQTPKQKLAVYRAGTCLSRVKTSLHVSGQATLTTLISVRMQACTRCWFDQCALVTCSSSFCIAGNAGKWETVPGEALLPGDIISIGRPSGTAAEDKVVPAGEWLLG